MAEKLWGHSPAGIFGYSHMLGGFAGGQAEYARVPFADVGPIKVPDGLARRAGAVPVGHLPHRLHGRGDVRHQAGRLDRRLGLRARSGQFAIASAYLLGAERVIAIDRFPYRLRHGARDEPARETHQLRGGRRPAKR